MLIGTDRENYSNTAGNFDIIKKPFWKREHAFNQRAFIVHYKCLKLRSHLADVEGEAQALFLRLVKEYAEMEGVTEQQKLRTQWSGYGR